MVVKCVCGVAAGGSATAGNLRQLVGVNCEESDPALYGNGRFDRFGFADDVGSLLYSHCRRCHSCCPPLAV